MARGLHAARKLRKHRQRYRRSDRYHKRRRLRLREEAGTEERRRSRKDQASPADFEAE